MGTALVPLSVVVEVVAVLVLFSAVAPPSPFSTATSLSFSTPPLARELSCLFSRVPAGVLFLENLDDVLLTGLGEGALELPVPGRGATSASGHGIGIGIGIRVSVP